MTMANVSELLTAVDMSTVHQGLKIVKGIAKARTDREKQAGEQAARNKALEARLQQEREAAVADEPMPQAEAPQPQEDEEPEPAVLQDSMMPAQGHTMDYGFLQLPEGVPESDLAAALYHLLVLKQVIDLQGATQRTLRGVFDTICFSTFPEEAYEQLLQHYSTCGAGSEGWLPSMSDIWSGLQKLGYSGTNTSTTKATGRRTTAGADAAASPPAEVPLANLRCLLKLVTQLCALHQQGHVRMNFGAQEMAAGKNLFIALVRLHLDKTVSSALFVELQSATEALIAPWDEVQWGRIADEAAKQLSEMGPSHRASLAAVAALPGSSSRKKLLQQHAALLLLHRVAPGSEKGTQASSSNRRGRNEINLDEVLEALAGPSKSPQDVGTRVRDMKLKGPGNKPDYWRILTMVEAANLCVWNSVYESSAEDAEHLAQLGKWYQECLKTVSRAMKSSMNSIATRIKVFVSETDNQYTFGCAHMV